MHLLRPAWMNEWISTYFYYTKMYNY
jgi:hypothetical protein